LNVTASWAARWRVRALFRDWQDATQEIWRHRPDEDQTEYDAAQDRQTEIEEEIARTLGGSVAMAIKVFLCERFDLCGWVPEPGMIRRIPLDKTEEERDWADDLTTSILRDAAKLAPELAELCAPIIHEDAVLIDAEIEVQWCRDRLLDPPHRYAYETTDHMAKIRYAADQARIGARLDRMLQRIEETAAKTDRGRAIKTALGFVEAEQETEGLR
jgi:hypothetical protein